MKCVERRRRSSGGEAGLYDLEILLLFVISAGNLCFFAVGFEIVCV